MKRDENLIRSLLLELEAANDFELDGGANSIGNHDEARHYHFMLMQDAGLVAHTNHGFFRLTSQGHDFLDAIRDEGLWQQTKAVVAESGGNVTVEILKQLAVGLLKKKINQHTDIEL
ncbi:MAG: DUF2513 domain-containing protein [Rhodobacteraceae bacterium]|nr:DUF2513 domain-containing protein [Alphaproteobacteria bacterium]NNK68402.1 DUF2513 domain-containing protein [Paracoccaceae bacterium]